MLFPQCGADADDRRALADGRFKVAAHAHREFIKVNTLWDERPQFVAQLAKGSKVAGRDGRAAFQRFTATREQTLGYYQSLSDVFTARQSPVARVFDAMVARMHALAGAESRVALPESP